MKRLAFLALIATAFLLAPARLHAQNTPATQTGVSASAQAVRVYLDCQSYYCDFDFFRTEITFVDWVRDRQVAAVHILITNQTTGSGGTSFVLNFLDLRSAGAATDTLTYISRQTDTVDEVRKALARVLKLGLVRFAARSEAAARIQITYTAPDSQKSAAKAKDPWNYWVFRTSMSGNFSGEKSSKRESLYGNMSANRVTEAWKISVGLNANYSRSQFSFDSTTSNFYSHSDGGYTQVVKSLTTHWSAGGTADASSSTRDNRKFTASLGPAVEYDFFPYTQSTRRMFTLRYSVTASTVNYEEETIYDETSERLMTERLQASVNARQPWGSIEVSAGGQHYLHDPSKWEATIFGNVDVRIFKGFSVGVFASAELLRDQLYLPKAGASRDDVLLQRRQLETGYSYFSGVNMSYTFGSIFNNIVNPRFGN